LQQQVIHLPCIVFQLSCLRCQTQRVVSESDVRAFRSSHGGHLHLARLHVVMLNRGGVAVRQTLPVLGQSAPLSLKGVPVGVPSNAASAGAAQLRGLLQILDGTPTSVQCGFCHSTRLPKDHSEMQEELDRHSQHLSELQIEFIVDPPAEYAGLQLRAQANRLPRSIWTAPSGLRLDCLFLELARQSGPKVSPWNAAVVASYLRDWHTQHKPAKFLTVIRGQSQAYVCQFLVTGFRSSQKISEWEELFLHPAMEEA
jgi:hypothetical protein